jgi:hypothetical protein
MPMASASRNPSPKSESHEVMCAQIVPFPKSVVAAFQMSVGVLRSDFRKSPVLLASSQIMLMPTNPTAPKTTRSFAEPIATIRRTCGPSKNASRPTRAVT